MSDRSTDKTDRFPVKQVNGYEITTGCLKFVTHLSGHL
jgi:hypothetical protein